MPAASTSATPGHQCRPLDLPVGIPRWSIESFCLLRLRADRPDATRNRQLHRRGASSRLRTSGPDSSKTYLRTSRQCSLALILTNGPSATLILIQTAAIVNLLASKHRPVPSTTSYMPGTAALLTIRVRCKRQSRSSAANGTDLFPTRMHAGSSMRSPPLRTNGTLRSAVPPTLCISKPCALRSTAKAFAFSWPRISARRRALGRTANRLHSAERRRRDGCTAPEQIPGYDGTDRVTKSPISMVRQCRASRLSPAPTTRPNSGALCCTALSRDWHKADLA